MSFASTVARRIRQLPVLLNSTDQVRRAYQRFPIEREVEIALGDGPPEPHMASDISFGGTFVHPPIKAQVTDEVLVSAGELLRDAPARIVAHRNGGSALQFQSPVHGALLTAWLRR